MAKKKQEKKQQLNIFDHLSNITFNKANWDKYTESDIKTFEPYMINRFLSMDINLIEIVNLFQKYTVGFLKKREIFNLYKGTLPKKKYFFKYIKGINEENYKSELLDYLIKYFQVSKDEVIEYLNIYYMNIKGKEEVVLILKKYGLDDKKINTLMKLKN